MQEVSLETLLGSGAHYGHQVRRWNPKMKPYIYKSEDGVHVFDLIKTKKAIEEALRFLKEASSKNKKIVIVGTKKQAKSKVKEVAKETGCFWVSERWLGGTLTNFDHLKTLNEMREKREKGEYEGFTKKERILIDKEIARLERFFGGLNGMEDLPDVLVVIDAKKEVGAVKEAAKTNVRTVAIADTNADPEDIDYVIPMNDDATKAVSYVLDLIKEAIMEGKKAKSTKKKAAKKKKSKSKKKK
jgi:small subunit ribosomal protein S2